MAGKPEPMARSLASAPVSPWHHMDRGSTTPAKARSHSAKLSVYVLKVNKRLGYCFHLDIKNIMVCQIDKGWIVIATLAFQYKI